MSLFKVLGLMSFKAASSTAVLDERDDSNSIVVSISLCVNCMSFSPNIISIQRILALENTVKLHECIVQTQIPRLQKNPPDKQLSKG